MKRTVLLYAFLAVTAAVLAAQQASQPGPYEGTSNPPPDETIVTPEPQPPPVAKPSPSQPAYVQPVAPVQPIPAAQPGVQPAPSNARPTALAPGMSDGTDDGIVQVAPDTSSTQPALNERAAVSDPDGDIVHPAPLPPGTLGEGTTIRVRLMDRLSTALNQSGDRFHTRVVSDVIQDGQVLIPAGSEIDGKVSSVSTGHLGGHGSMRLQPEYVLLADGSRFHLYAQTTGAPGSNQRVGSEGAITPGSRLKKDGIEYGAATGVGLIAGGALGGPGGALAGGIIGAGVITVHLMVDHPQATLEDGTVLLFTLNEPLHLVAAAQTGN
ncbi:MAG: hypothetical protein ABSB50_10360 [Terracidiphilus sp.]